MTITRDDVLDVLESVSKLSRKRLQRADVPVHFWKNRIAVLLPADRYVADEMIKLDGKFQVLMTTRKHAHAYLDFVHADQWQGAATPLRGGFS